ncbi:MAG: Gfo/Idh/MocA family oxidoreductase [Raineya sp.]|jgi:predicted dehydrogenase|nr:Gfo/Idh/MocA family oxidoreductase [Raineya sp.]
MKVIVIGVGRMGTRHAQGLLQVAAIEELVLVDMKEEALENAKNTLSPQSTKKLSFIILENFLSTPPQADIVIDASTAQNRTERLENILKTNCKYILIEKPLGQSLEQVEELIYFSKKQNTPIFVNLNMRMYDVFRKIRQDLQKLPQLQGFANISVNTGTLGIGANGIHYLDLCMFLLDANKTELVAGEIEETIIPSGRGSNFGDFGGWAMIKFFKDNTYKGRLQISMSSESTVFGSWEIVAPHGRIQFNEVECKLNYQVRKADSQMPINRYFADYQSIETKNFESPFLGDLTKLWIETLIKEGKSLLPMLEESLETHKLMFAWLSLSKTHQKSFPIT